MLEKLLHFNFDIYKFFFFFFFFSRPSTQNNDKSPDSKAPDVKQEPTTDTKTLLLDNREKDEKVCLFLFTFG